jgi:hypothetical protein
VSRAGRQDRERDRVVDAVGADSVERDAGLQVGTLVDRSDRLAQRRLAVAPSGVVGGRRDRNGRGLGRLLLRDQHQHRDDAGGPNEE